jgi:hypothetical protein
MKLFVDTTRCALVSSPTNPVRVQPPTVTVGDTIPLTLAFLTRNPQPLNTGYPIFNYLDLSAAGVVFSIGLQEGQPSAGTFPLTFGASTAIVAFNVSAYALSVALNLLPSIIAVGGVTVTGPICGPYSISFVANGVQALFTSGANALFPACVVRIVTDLAGTLSNPAVQVVGLWEGQAVQVSSWIPQAAAAVIVAPLSGNLIQRVIIPLGTYGGSFTLSYNGNTTAAIPFAAQLDVVQAALQVLAGLTGVTVWPGQNFWDITIPSGAFPLTGNAAGLIVPFTLTGSLVLSDQDLADLLHGTDLAFVPFYIQATIPTTQTYVVGNIQLQIP